MMRHTACWPQTPGQARQRGIASVEFAIGVVVVLLLMLVAAEFGRAYYSFNTLTKAVRNGSRYLSTVALNPAYVVDLTGVKVPNTKNMVIHGNISGSGAAVLDGLAADNITLSQKTPTGVFSPYVQVAATYDYQPIFGAVSSFGFGNDYDFGFTMQVASTMRVLK